MAADFHLVVKTRSPAPPFSLSLSPIAKVDVMSRKVEYPEYDRLRELQQGSVPLPHPRQAPPADFAEYLQLIAAVRFYSVHFRIDRAIREDLKALYAQLEVINETKWGALANRPSKEDHGLTPAHLICRKLVTMVKQLAGDVDKLNHVPRTLKADVLVRTKPSLAFPSFR